MQFQRGPSRWIDNFNLTATLKWPIQREKNVELEKIELNLIGLLPFLLGWSDSVITHS